MLASHPLECHTDAPRHLFENGIPPGKRPPWKGRCRYGRLMVTTGPRQRPPRLQAGQTVAVVAPSSGFLEPSVLERGLHVLRDLGLEPVIAPGVREIRGYLAGDDRRRAEDLRWALESEEVDAVWCARGGYGAQRTVAALEALEPGTARRLAGQKPKVLVGFSDVTVVHALLAQAGWVSFYGPTVSVLGRASEYTLQALERALFKAEPFTVLPDPDDPWVSTLVPGRAEGELAGGCLTLLAALVGTPLQVDFADKVAVFEDVDEPAHAIDRSLSQLLAAGCFAGCRAIAIGDHTNVAARGGSSLGVEQLFADLLGPLGLPCCFYLPIGHGAHQATLPLGTRAALDADAGVIELLEPGVA